jgi:signal transduction histidine kinase
MNRMIKIVEDLLLLAEVESDQLVEQPAVVLKYVLLGELKRVETLVGGKRAARRQSHRG